MVYWCTISHVLWYYDGLIKWVPNFFCLLNFLKKNLLIIFISPLNIWWSLTIEPYGNMEFFQITLMMTLISLMKIFSLISHQFCCLKNLFDSSKFFNVHKKLLSAIYIFNIYKVDCNTKCFVLIIPLEQYY
jgi:hypothetical protein